MLNIVPFFVFIFAVLFLKESLSPAGVIGIFLVTFSVYLLNISKKENIFYPFYQLFKHKRYIIFLPILLFSVTAILDKLTLNSINPLTFIFYLSIFLVINFLILILSVKKLQETKEILVKDYKQYLIIGLLLFISQIGQYFATSLKEISIVNPLLMLSSIIVIVSSRKLFKETDIYMKITSTFILIVGMALILI
ncbi:MAG: EamA family transporter [Nanoarchaeota archaeon]|nr:EamA family transporter [Nanoarchaeota archaeon]